MLYNVDSFYERVMHTLDEVFEANGRMQDKVDKIKAHLRKFEKAKSMSNEN